MLDRGILINRTHETVLRFLPPYIIQKKHVDEVIRALDSALASQNYPGQAQCRDGARCVRQSLPRGSTTLSSQAINTPRSVSATTGIPCRDLISIRDLGPIDVEAIFDLAGLMKSRPLDFREVLAGKQIVMFFEKPSLRTRVTFEAGMASLGRLGHFRGPNHTGRLDAREKLSDIAHNLERWVDGIVLRTFSHATVDRNGGARPSIPVINALSDLEHPCQALADYFTLQERFGDLKKVQLAYVGDGNNVAHSLLLACACIGSRIRVATPLGFAPDRQIVAAAQAMAGKTGAGIELLTDPREAVRGADAIYTDAWASMGQEQEAGKRARIFPPYQINDELVAEAAPQAVVMHCLPAHRGEEITDRVIDFLERSIVFDQSENRSARAESHSDVIAGPWKESFAGKERSCLRKLCLHIREAWTPPSSFPG